MIVGIAHPVLRCAVLILAALLAADAGWCCDDATNVQSLTLASASDVCDDDVAHVDCHACICSGLALIETTSPPVPPVQISVAPATTAARPMSQAASVEIPPDERT